jgi:cyanophycin synthetase
MLRQGFDCNDLIIEVAPSYLLQAGIPFSRAEMAVVVDANLVDVPPRYAERDRAAKLMSVVADGVKRNGIVVVPAKEWEIQEMVRDADCRVAIFSTRDNITRRDKKLARTSVWVDERRIIIEHLGELIEGGWIQDESNLTAQIAAATAVFSLKQLLPASAAHEA